MFPKNWKLATNVYRFSTLLLEHITQSTNKKVLNIDIIVHTTK